MKKSYYLGLFLEISLLLLFLGCASKGTFTPKNLSQKEKEEYNLLKEAGANSNELKAYILYHLTPALESEKDSIWTEFWDRKYHALTDQEKAVYYNLTDSLSRRKYLSFTNERDRRDFIKQLQNKEINKLMKTKEDKILYFSLKLLFSKEEMKEFLMTPDSLKEEWLRVWWKKRDPDLTTEVNEFKVVFDQRVLYALTYFDFSLGHKPWDDRGDVYILYGEPDDVGDAEYYSESQDSFFPIQDLAGTRTMDQKAEDMLSRSQVWIYDKYGEFQFQDKHVTGYWELAPHKRLIGDDNARVMTQFLQTKVVKMELAKADVKIDFGGKPLEFPWDWWRFWNEGDTYDLKVNLGIPLDQLGAITDSLHPDTSWLIFTEKVAVSDEQSMKTVYQDSTTIRKKMPKNLNRKDLFWVDQACFDSLPPDDYVITVSVRDSATQKIGIYNTTVILVRHVHVTGQAKISQLIMADSVWLADSNYVTENGGKFIRNSLVILPHPGNVYPKEKLVDYYCELYELKKGKNDSLNALVTYNLLHRAENDSFALYAEPKSEYATWPSIGGQPFLKGRLNLPKGKGEYVLHIIVYDLNDPKAKKEDLREAVAKFTID